MFEQLNQLHKRAAKLGKGTNFAKRTHRPLSKDQNFSKKNGFSKFWKIAYQNTEMMPKRIPWRISMA
jgi:hypothetical protein